MDIIFFGHDVNYGRLAFALADKFPHDLRLVFYCNKPGLAWFARNRLGLHTIRAGSGRIWKRFKPVDQVPFKLDMRFYPTCEAMLPIWHAVAQWHYMKSSETLCDIAPALFVCPGEYRITEQAFLAVIEKKYPNTPVIFFEAGPGPYVYLDRQGVNANASFAHSPTPERAKSHEALLATANFNEHSSNKLNDHRFAATLAKAIDLAWVLVLEWLSPVNEFGEYVAALRNRYQLWKNKHLAKNSASSSVMTGSGKYLLFVDQVRSDVNATHFGCPDSSIFSQITSLLESNPDWNLVWRPHPLERREGLFNEISQIAPGRVHLSNNTSFSEELTCAAAVLTVNSNGGLDALLAGLPILLFGTSYYQQLPGVTRSPKDLSSAISTGVPSALQISRSAESFIRDRFIPLDYRGRNFSNASALAFCLLAYVGRQGDVR